jgi:hypothetical protein
MMSDFFVSADYYQLGVEFHVASPPCFRARAQAPATRQPPHLTYISLPVPCLLLALGSSFLIQQHT